MATTNAARVGRVPARSGGLARVPREPGRQIGLAGAERADFVRFRFDPATGAVRIDETYLSGRCVFRRGHAV
jgi:hypothetical protein